MVINKCATMIIRPKNFDSNGSPDPTFYIDNHPLPKTSYYTYLGIPFPNTLNLKPLISILNDKLNHSMNSHYIHLSNKHIPLHIKKYILFDEYSTGPTVVKSVDVETVRQGRIFPSDTDLITTVNRPVIIDEWEKLDNTASSSLI